MTDRLHSSRIFSLLIVLFMLSWSGSQFKLLREEIKTIPLKTDPPAVESVAARVYYLDQNERVELSARLEVIETNENAGYILVRLTPAELDVLEAQGFRIEVDDRDT